MDKKWQIKTSPAPEKVSQLAAELGVDPILATLLLQRGVETFEAAREFFRPSLDSLHDPFLMKDMDVAVERLHEAVVGGQGICVYGDYDVDGTTAGALVYSFLRELTSKVEFYIPDRYEEGSGVSKKGIDTAAKDGCSLLITLDCGIKASDKIDYAKTKKIDTIVCDHHLPDDTLPEAVAILDPKREDDSYPFDELCACGVGFKLVQGYAIRYGIPLDEIYPLLDLLAVSIAADLVSITGENRILSHFGLLRLNTAPREGLRAIMDLAHLEAQHVTIDDIVFKIGPRINAAGRMESGRLAVELLTAQDAASATVIGAKINENNNKRKSIDREMTREALEMVEQGKAVSNGHTTIVYNAKWNKGVVGIVASRLVEAFYKPAFVMTKSKEFVTGSARSVHGFDLYDAIKSCSDLLENFGGHIYAAGLTLKEENLPEFARRIEEYVATHMTEEETVPAVEVDAVVDFSQLTPKFLRFLKQFQPFGPGNSMPLFMTENVYDYGSARKVGPGGKHLKLDLIQEPTPGGGYRQISAIGFNMSEWFDYIKAGNPIDICYSVFENYYRGNSTMQLRIREVRRHEEGGIDDLFSQ